MRINGSYCMARIYYKRLVDNELDELLRSLPAVAIEGPKAVGKTETARQRASTEFRLDDPLQRAVVEADPSLVLKADPPVLIDEWQRVPSMWDTTRRAVDDEPLPGRFILTGSASPTTPPTHSGAGRIVSIRMRPMSLVERQMEAPTVSLGALLQGDQPAIAGQTDVALADYTQEILLSGFPGFRGLSGRALRTQIDGYLARIVDTDFQEMGHPVRRPALLRRWMVAYAAATATTATYETIRDAATHGEADKPAKTTTIPYRDVLERLWILDPVEAWLPSHNRLARLIRPPKHHLVDPALAASLIGVDARALLAGDPGGVPIPRDGTLLGHLFESLMTQSVRIYAQSNEARVYHLRTANSAREVDLIIERRDGRVLAIEIKLGGNVEDRDVRHLLWLREKLGEDVLDTLVLTTGPVAYRRRDGVAVIPAALLGP